MRIGTYNVLGLKGYPPIEAMKALGEGFTDKKVSHFSRVFAELDCDVLNLQEGVAAGEMQRIARALDLNLATFPSPTAWPGHLLTRYEIIESRVFSHVTPEAERLPWSRCFGAALLRVDPKTTLWVVNVHLHPGDAALRVQESDILEELLPTLLSTATHLVIAGDFSGGLKEHVHVHLHRIDLVNVMVKMGGIQATMDTAGMKPHFVDHIYVTPSLAGRLTSAYVVRDPGFRHDGSLRPGLWVHSDHLPVIAEFTL